MFSTLIVAIVIAKLAGKRTRSRRRPSGRHNAAGQQVSSSTLKAKPHAVAAGPSATRDNSRGTYSHIRTVTQPEHPPLASSSQIPATSDVDAEPTFITPSVHVPAVPGKPLASTGSKSPLTPSKEASGTATTTTTDMSSTASSFAAKARAAEAGSRAREAGRELDESELPRNPPVALAAYTKFKPVSRNKGVKAWRPLDQAELAAAPPDVSAPVQAVEDAPPNRKATASPADSPETSSGEEDFPRLERRDKGKGRQVDITPHPLRQEIKPDSSPPAVIEPAPVESQTGGMAESTPGPLPAPVTGPVLVALPPFHQQGNVVGGVVQSPEQNGNGYRCTPERPAAGSDVGPQSNQAEVQDAGQERARAATLTAASAAPRVKDPNSPALLKAQAAVLAGLGVEHPLRNLPGHMPLRPQVMAHDLNGNAGQGAMGFDFRFPPLQGRHVHMGAPLQLHQPQPRPQHVRLQEQPHQMHHHPPQGPPHPPPPVYQHQGPPRAPQAQHGPPEPAQEHHQSNREMLLKSLHGIAATNPARPSNARTVMYDPAAVHPRQPTTTAASEPFPPFEPRSEGQVSRNSLDDQQHPMVGHSSPLQWKDRPVEIFVDEGPPKTDEELRKQRRETIERANAIYRPSAEHVRAERAASHESTQTWWSRDGREQGELRNYLQRLVDRQRPQLAGAPQPSRTEEITNTLLVPLLSNLHGYVAEPPLAQHGSFGSFAPVPDWCVDGVRNGAGSFFGEDWGAPPARVGRDPRYRPMMHSHSHQGFGGGYDDVAEWGMHWGRQRFHR
ncbi:MAG: hypothetical protein M1832_004601 [Thelocarpon impressellum]|nr:MAG: hypothetical protein M1832_004601 [Thelocarpon impressellum]